MEREGEDMATESTMAESVGWNERECAQTNIHLHIPVCHSHIGPVSSFRFNILFVRR